MHRVDLRTGDAHVSEERRDVCQVERYVGDSGGKKNS